MTEVKLLGGQGRGDYAEARLAEFVANCRRKKMAVTPQRLAVLRALLESGDHPRADRIYARVRREHPRISLATVHRTLERLCDVGEARKVTPLHETARYDGNTRPHHHVVCVRCAIDAASARPAVPLPLSEHACGAGSRRRDTHLVRAWSAGRTASGTR